jgi:hypothetical protein
MRILATNSGIDMMGADFYVLAHVKITHWGCEAKLYGPPENCYEAEDPEYEIVSLSLRRDEPGGLGPEWSIDPDHALFDVLSEHDNIREACDEAVIQEANERRFEMRYRRRRAF